MITTRTIFAAFAVLAAIPAAAGLLAFLSVPVLTNLAVIKGAEFHTDAHDLRDACLDRNHTACHQYPIAKEHPRTTCTGPPEAVALCERSETMRTFMVPSLGCFFFFGFISAACSGLFREARG